MIQVGPREGAGGEPAVIDGRRLVTVSTKLTRFGVRSTAEVGNHVDLVIPGTRNDAV